MFRVRYLPLILLTGLVCFLGNTTGYADEELKEYHYLFPKTSLIWPTPQIPVCWENPDPDNRDGRLWSQQAVEDSWELYSALDFVGWDECHPYSRGLRILIADMGAHTKGLGSNLDGVENGVVLNFTFQHWSEDCRVTREDCIRTVAVHEFGHAIGIAHEHNRKDAPKCDKERQGSDGDWLVTPYDLYSVMNYCNPEWAGGGELSELDIRGLQTVYGIAEDSPETKDLEYEYLLTCVRGVGLDVNVQYRWREHEGWIDLTIHDGRWTYFRETRLAGSDSSTKLELRLDITDASLSEPWDAGLTYLSAEPAQGTDCDTEGAAFELKRAVGGPGYFIRQVN